MQPIFQSPFPRLTADKVLHDVQLIFTASLKSARVVENITFMTTEYDFVLDVVLATLQAGFSRSAFTGKE
jgi:hypothetical protein